MNTRPIAELDLECFHDYFLAKFYVAEASTFYSYGMWPGHPLDREAIVQILKACTIITFNGNNYDLPMLMLALHGADTDLMKYANDQIIVHKLKPWQFYDRFRIGKPPEYIDHIDIMEPTPGVRIGLKMYMGRLHAPKIQDLPFDPTLRPNAVQRFELADYCGNDLVGTMLLRKEIWDRIELRQAISERYGVDVRSKSDAQIAEAVINASLDFKPQARYIEHGYTFYYAPPDYIQYATPQMQELLEVVKRAPFVVTDKEEAFALYGDASGIRTGVNIPNELKDRDIVIGHGKYRIGIGGLHSQEQSTSHYAIPGVQSIRDVDVKSYYPSLILTMDMYPSQIGPQFIEIYRGVYNRRLSAKAESARLAKLANNGDNDNLKDDLLRRSDLLLTESNGLKIVLNGTFGKLFSKYSRPLYAPELGIRTTITGQLGLLMLIEMMELSGIRVVSANTDGIVLLIPHGKDQLASDIVKWWEQRTGLEMEDEQYRSIHSRDVNNYVAITTGGKVKRKGIFVPGGILTAHAGKGPNMDICADAVVAFLKDGVPIADTILKCQDIRKFIVLRGVSGGGYYDGNYLGKAVRWYYGATDKFICNHIGHKVATSDGAVPVMQLPDEFPRDINYQRYINEANEMLAHIGVK